MLIVSSAAGDVGFLDTITVIVASIPELQPFLETLEIIRFALGGLASLGGNIVIIGGFLLTIDRVTTGKILIGLGAGMGIFGLVIQWPRPSKVASLVSNSRFVTLPISFAS